MIKKNGIICGFVGVLFYPLWTEPDEPLVHQLYEYLQVIGLAVILSMPAIEYLRQPSKWTYKPYRGQLMSNFVWQLTFYALAVFMVGLYGDSIYRWFVQNQQEAIVVSVACGMVGLVLFCSKKVFDEFNTTFPFITANAPLSTAQTSRPTSRDLEYIAAHEAGHVLVYAALEDLPAGMMLKVNEKRDEYGVLGFVTGVESDHCLTEAVFEQWTMLVLLAGKFGETIAKGKSTLGSCNDYQRWLETAHLYLSHHIQGIYYLVPKSQLEQQQNEAKLKALQDEQLALLDKLFEMNMDVFQEMMSELLKSRVLGEDELKSLLSKVKLPEGFPLPGTALSVCRGPNEVAYRSQ